MAATWFVICLGASDTSLVRSEQGNGRSQREVVPSSVVYLIVNERGPVSRAGQARTPDIQSCTEGSGGRDSTDEEGCELHGGGWGESMVGPRYLYWVVVGEAVSEYPWRQTTDSFPVVVISSGRYAVRAGGNRCLRVEFPNTTPFPASTGHLSGRRTIVCGNAPDCRAS